MCSVLNIDAYFNLGNKSIDKRCYDASQSLAGILSRDEFERMTASSPSGHEESSYNSRIIRALEI